MVKKLLLLILLVFQHAVSQTKQITILDAQTNEPIGGVHVFYTALGEGSYTNEEGQVSIVVKKAYLVISHLNYEELTISPEKIESLENIKLKSVDIELDEVVVNTFKLKKALKNVLNNYYNLYVDYATEKECSFKEKLVVDGKIHRLILSELKLWTKDAALNNRELDKVTRLKLGAISESRNVPLLYDINDQGEYNPDASGNIVTKSLLANTYLDVVISIFLNYSGMVEETVENSSSDYIVVSYTTDWKNVNNVANRTKGKVVFDKETMAIVEFIKEVDLKNDIQNKTSKFSGKKYKYETKKQVSKYTFSKGLNGKYSLSRFSLDADVLLFFEENSYEATFKNDLFILKETKKRKVDKKGLLDLDQPIYKALPSGVVNSNNILLTAKEKAFLEASE